MTVRTALLLVVLSGLARAGQYDGRVVVLSRYAPEAKLSNMLAEAESLARTGRFVGASLQLDKAVQSCSPALMCVLSNTTAGTEPFWNAFKVAKLQYLLTGYQYHGIPLDIEQVALMASDAPATFMPWYVQTMLDRGERPEKIRAAVREYQANGGGMDADMGRLDCELLRREGSNALAACMAYLERFPSLPQPTMRQILDIARATLDVGKPDTIRTYYRWMATLILRQPGDDAHMETMAYLMGEQRKIETLVPDVVGKAANPAPAAQSAK